MNSKFNVYPLDSRNHLTQPLILGDGVNLQRYDTCRYQFLKDMADLQDSFFWRPEIIPLGKDKGEYELLDETQKFIFLSNLKYQSLLDSVQGRAPLIVLGRIASCPEFEAWLNVWTYFERIHSKSYTHIVQNIIPNPSEVFDDILINDAIIKRAVSVSKYWNDLDNIIIQYELNNATKLDVLKSFYLAMCAVNALEAIRFYNSFACSFAFVENKIMEGNGTIITSIAQDENIHLQVTQWILNNILELFPEFEPFYMEYRKLGYDIFMEVKEQEIEWAKYLFKDGSTLLGLNEQVLVKYNEYISNIRLKALGYDVPTIVENPIPWIDKHLNSDNVQIAHQETGSTKYLFENTSADVNLDELADLGL